MPRYCIKINQICNLNLTFHFNINKIKHPTVITTFMISSLLNPNMTM